MGARRFAVEMTRVVSVSLACAAMGTGAIAQAPLPSHGPAKGYLVITGGGPDYKNFLALAGGKNAHIVVIPTAAITRQEDEKMLPPYCKAEGPFAGMKCTVLHTTDRNCLNVFFSPSSPLCQVLELRPQLSPSCAHSDRHKSGGSPMFTSIPRF
jgi:hypothetical protein